MADKQNTTPPTTAAEIGNSPVTPNPRGVKMSSLGRPTQTTEGDSTVEEQPQSSQTDDVAAEANPALARDEEQDDLEADDDDADSAFGTDNSDTTSLSSSIYEGYVENGRRYQTTREGEYWGPSDEKQFQSMQAAHIVYAILDSKEKNTHFRSPIPDTAQNILDIGTGTGIWACEVADRYPGALVQGVDLYPPPDTWVPPNCKFEVDDVLKPWEFKQNGRFDLIHLRDMFGSFTDEQWRLIYKQAYKNLAPGGWIEQVEPSAYYASDDGSLKPDSLLAGWGPMFNHLTTAGMGKSLDTISDFKSRIAAAGFTNIHEKLYKVPLGDWAKDPVLKEAGKLHKMMIEGGMEGYAMFLLTTFGEPTPWTSEEVQVYLAKVRNEWKAPGLHTYGLKRRVWAQKPHDTEPKGETKAEVYAQE